jgi:N-acetylglucosaminyl-diphospho-decaprenol L-rhamnosyltransferase
MTFPMTKATHNDYGVVIVSFGSGTVLDSFLDSLAKSDCQPDHVVVVENGPHLLDLNTKDFSLTIIHRPDNPGYGTAVNIGVEALPQNLPWVLVSNPDVKLQTDAVTHLMNIARNRPEAGSLGPALVNPDGSIYPSARAVPGLAVGIGHALLGPWWKTNPWTSSYRGSYSSPEPRECGWLSGACLLVRRQAFDDVAGFDTGYFMFMEDVDLGMRLGKAGWSNLYVPQAKAEHEVGHATSGVQVAMARAHHHSAKRFLTRRYPGPWWAPIRLVLNLGLTLRQWLVHIFRKSGG